jgi:hypothetical protein
MRLTVLLTLGGTLLASLPAHAELRGIALYERGDYVRARRVLTEELNAPGLSKQDQAKARLYLAAALFASGAEESAQAQLEELAMQAPSFQVDPILFPPDFVALADRARAKAEAKRQEERQRQEAERQRLEAERLEAERKAREEAEARNGNQNPPEEEEGEGPSDSMRLRPDVFGYVDAVGKRIGVGGGLTLGLGMVDLNARVLMGTRVGMGAELGLLFGSGMVQPRLALRGTAVPGASAYGGGAVAGVRLAASNRLTFLLDLGAEYLAVEDTNAYRTFVLTSTAGVGFDLL